MKIHPKKFTIEVDKGPKFQMVGNPNPVYVNDPSYEVHATLDDSNEINNLQDMCFNNKKQSITICRNNQEYYIKNAMVTGFDVSIGANNAYTELTVDFVSTEPDTVTFDLLDKKNMVIPRESYDIFVAHYGKPESMMYEDFYNKYVAVEI